MQYVLILQKQLISGLLKIAALKNVEIIIAKYLYWSLFLKTLAVNMALMNRVMEFWILKHCFVTSKRQSLPYIMIRFNPCTQMAIRFLKKLKLEI